MYPLLEVARARVAQRSYWMLRYVDGTVIREWESDWSALPLEGRQSLRLLCPDGQIAELGSTDATGRLFQLKVAIITAGAWNGTVAQVVGLVEHEVGSCRYAAWDYEQGKLVTGNDNVYAMQYQQIGRVAFEPMGLTLK